MTAARVVVGMSGGVDSSVAAAMLQEAGFEVIGLFMKNWEEDDDGTHCAAAVDLDDATRVCEKLDIPLRTVNFSHEYWERVFMHFLAEHRAGRTPNPDVLCNREIKFKEFLHWAARLGADFIATGHYAQTAVADGGHRLRKGHDPQKDQSYFLHAVDESALVRCLFPVGRLTKSEVRSRARRLGLANHDKKDSTGICFIGERKFRSFLQRWLPPEPGTICDADDRVVGRHEGLMYYTIGQRHGLGIGGAGQAWYVAGKDLDRNVLRVVQGHDHPALLSRGLLAQPLHWIAPRPPPAPLACRAKIRYRHPEQPCTVDLDDDGRARVSFETAQWGVTPGQSVVFYDGDTCLGGGVIDQALP